MKKKPRKKPGPVSWDPQQPAVMAGVERGPDGIGFKFERLPVPTRDFEAEAAWVERRFGAVSMFFGKSAPGGTSRLGFVAEIRLSYESFLALWKTTEVGVFRDRLNTWAGQASALEAERAPVEFSSDDVLSYTWFRATVVLLSHTGTEAELSFYALPVTAVSSAVRDQSVNQVPVISIMRVTTTGHELVRFLNDCERLHVEIAPLLSKGKSTEVRRA